MTGTMRYRQLDMNSDHDHDHFFYSLHSYRLWDSRALGLCCWYCLLQLSCWSSTTACILQWKTGWKQQPFNKLCWRQSMALMQHWEKLLEYIPVMHCTVAGRNRTPPQKKKKMQDSGISGFWAPADLLLEFSQITMIKIVAAQECEQVETQLKPVAYGNTRGNNKGTRPGNP